jgi:hypothetical protein
MLQSEVTPFSFGSPPGAGLRRGGSIAYAALSVCGSGSRICDAVQRER